MWFIFLCMILDDSFPRVMFAGDSFILSCDFFTWFTIWTCEWMWFIYSHIAFHLIHLFSNVNLLWIIFGMIHFPFDSSPLWLDSPLRLFMYFNVFMGFFIYFLSTSLLSHRRSHFVHMLSRVFTSVHLHMMLWTLVSPCEVILFCKDSNVFFLVRDLAREWMLNQKSWSKTAKLILITSSQPC